MTSKKMKPRKLTSAAFPYESRFVEVGEHRIHYVEQGQGAPILFLHGNPTSSYTFRNVIAGVAEETGRRVIAMDLLGMGKSDKPSTDHSCARHTEVIEGFIEALDLEGIILVAEDWGGFLGVDVMTRRPERFESAVLMETFLWPMTTADDFEPSIIWPFRLMRSPLGDVFTRGMNLMINKLIPEHCPISDEALDHYRQALPTWAAKKAMADFPRLLPVDGHPAQSHAFAMALGERLSNVSVPVLWLKSDPGVIVSMNNPIGMGRLDALRRTWPQIVVRDFGPGYHFLSEEDPERVVSMVSAWVRERAISSASEGLRARSSAAS